MRRTVRSAPTSQARGGARGARLRARMRGERSVEEVRRGPFETTGAGARAADGDSAVKRRCVGVKSANCGACPPSVTVDNAYHERNEVAGTSSPEIAGAVFSRCRSRDGRAAASRPDRGRDHCRRRPRSRAARAMSSGTRRTAAGRSKSGIRCGSWSRHDCPWRFATARSGRPSALKSAMVDDQPKGVKRSAAARGRTMSATQQDRAVRASRARTDVAADETCQRRN